jgi:diguanylate cyclase (GGDEF)-like protein
MREGRRDWGSGSGMTKAEDTGQPATAGPSDGGAERPQGATGWTLGRKVLVALACLALMVGAWGAVGLVFLTRIADSASMISGVTSPLIIESMALGSNADKMRAVLSKSDTLADSAEEAIAELSRLAAEGREHELRFKALAAKAGLTTELEPIEQLRLDYAATLKQMVEVNARKEQANAGILQAYEKSFTAIETVEARLGEMASRFGDMAPKDPRAVALRSLSEKVVEMHDLATTAFLAKSELDLDRSETALGVFVAEALPAASDLDRRLSAHEKRASSAEIQPAVTELNASFLGPEGLITRKRDLLTAAALSASHARRFGEIEERYDGLLAGAAASVRRLSDEAAGQMTQTSAQARLAVVAMIVLTALTALVVGLFLTLSISRPLERLTQHVRRLRRRGELIEIGDEALLSAGDEVGVLSRDINGMITELAEARQRLIVNSEAEITKQADRLRDAIAHMSQGLVMYDHNQRLIICNDRYGEIYGIPPERITPGLTLRDVLYLRVAAGTHHGDPETYLQRRLGANRDGDASDTVVELQNGRVVQILRRPLKYGGWVSTHEDITERRQIEAKIAHMAHHDVLTNLPNRTLFRERMEDSLVRSARGELVAVFCLDLDHFKTVNDTLGHSIGDALLRAVTERLLGCVRETDTVARLGGDEFAVIQIGLDTPCEASVLAQRIIDRMAAPFVIDAHQVVIGTSVGIAVAPNDGREADDLLKKADLALYRAKSDGRNTYRFFEPDMDASMQTRRQLELELRSAISMGQFELHYQPLVNLNNRQVTSFEALLRWRHPERGQVSPAEFIPLAEEIGLIIQIGEWVIHQACHDATTWPENVHIAVNLSPVQFKSRKLVETITLALTNSGLAANRLELEITESVLLNDSQATLATLRQIKELGVRIAMDDFGTGYSSLSYLRSFPFDRIKIDRSFIRDLGKSEESAAIVRAVTSLGASLGMAIIAEGVETAEQFDRLREEGCTEVQGFFIGKPKTLAEIAPLLDDIRRAAAA